MHFVLSDKQLVIGNQGKCAIIFILRKKQLIIGKQGKCGVVNNQSMLSMVTLSERATTPAKVRSQKSIRF